MFRSVSINSSHHNTARIRTHWGAASFALMLCLASCLRCVSAPATATVPKPNEDAPSKSLVIALGDDNVKVLEALRFLQAKEPETYQLLFDYIRHVIPGAHPYWSRIRFPDTIEISAYSFTRGTVYLASLLFHELCHLMFIRIRLEPDQPVENARLIAVLRRYDPFITVADIRALSFFDVEKKIHFIQLRFLYRYGDIENAKVIKDAIGELPSTYRHLLP